MSRVLVFTPAVVPNGGINEANHDQHIADNEWSEGTNIEPLPDGCRSRRGSTASNATALGDGIQGICDLQLSDGSTTAHVVWATGKLYTNSAGTMTEATHAAGAGVTDADTHFCWTIGNDRLFYTDNSNVPRKYYSVGTTWYHENVGIAKPTDDLTVAAATAGSSLADGTYYIDYYFWNDDLSLPSDRYYGGLDTKSVVLSGGSEHISISGIPSAVARTGDRATHVRIEVKFPGTSYYALYQTVALGTTTATVESDDAEGVEAEYVHQLPPVHQVGLVAANRHYLLNVANAPYRLQFSAIVGFTPHYESFPTLNYRDFGKGDGDYGTALFYVAPRSLVVGFRNSIYMIDPRQPKTSDAYLISDRVGIAGHNAGVVVNDTLYFVSDSKENKGMYSWNAREGLQKIGLKIDDTFHNLNLGRLNKASCVFYAPDKNRHQWWTLLSGAGAGYQSTVLVYDTLIGAWTVYNLAINGNVAGVVEESGLATPYIGGNDGVEYKMDVDGASDDDGNSFASSFRAKAFDFGEQGSAKRMRFLDYTLSQETAGNRIGVSCSIERDRGATTPITLTLTPEIPPTAMVWNTGVYGTGVWGGDENGGQTAKRASARGRARTFSPQFSGQDNLWHLKNFSFAIQPSRKKKFNA